MHSTYPHLKQTFGHAEFREGQKEVVDALLSGRDALGIMPTGAGKSICFQLPALMLPGTTLVISPLISLMKDQVQALRQMGVPAAYINSSLSPAQLAAATRRACQGQYKIIYVAPERLMVPDFMDFTQTGDISLVTVDEAHCVSQWGQDFRPSYLRIRDFLDGLPRRPTVAAFTATATPRVRDDILSLIGLQDPLAVSTGFDRPNLFFWVQMPKNKYKALGAYLSGKRASSGIVYCATRKNVESVCEKLQQDGFSATRYHAGLSDLERAENQEAFRLDEKRIMVATNAFGMGIDKSNVSFVVHYNMPQDVESYYQEAGRAGRDGEPADCLLLFGRGDIVTAKMMIERTAEDNDQITPQERQKLIGREMQKLYQMIRYCEGAGCLRAYLLRYFGDEAKDECGHCSNCLGMEFEVSPEFERAGKQKPARTPTPARAVPIPQAVGGAEEGGLYQVLAALRTDIARSAGVPGYVVFSNAALRDMALKRPRTEDQMLDVSGVGEVKLAKYGAVFLKAIREYGQGEARDAPPRALEKAEVAVRPWPQDEDRRLRVAYLNGVDIGIIEQLHERDEAEIRERLRVLGLAGE